MWLRAACVLSAAVAVLGSEDGEYDTREETDSRDHPVGTGMVQESSRPMLVFYDASDPEQARYCARFEGIEEWQPKSDGSGDMEKVFELESDKVQWNYIVNTDATDTTWLYKIESSTPAANELNGVSFVFRTTTVSLNGVDSFAVKFDIVVDGYTWTNTGDKLAFDFNMRRCESEYGRADEGDDDELEASTEEPTRRRRLSGSSDGSGSGDSANSESSDDETTTAVPTRRRRLSEGSDDDDSGDSDDRESNDGLDSEDDHRYNLDAAVFIVAPTAQAQDGSTVTVTLNYDGSMEHIQVVFDYFVDSATLDPTLAVNNGLFTSAAVSARVSFSLLAALLALAAMLLA